MILIDGKAAAAKLKKEIATEVAAMIDKNQKAPHLVAILVGDDPASQTYVASKEKASRSVGITSSIYRLSAKTSEKELLELISFLNNDEDVDGFIVQLPLPDHINVEKIINSIDYRKDVDGFHPMNVGKMVLGESALISATPQGILYLLETYKIETKGKNVVVLGRSNIVGTPMSILLSRKSEQGDATVTLCHSRTKNLSDITKKADIIIAAIGKPEFLKADMVKKGVVIIDVGIHRIPDEKAAKGYRLTGDVDFAAVSKKASHITPVPGGVGPMTIAALLKNTLLSTKK
ncbi:MAG: bifunctional methylenetetrahydrofolate dehydrogenase/methenyltetrahydrofolate cyclohydrolase FolD [Bacteroidales bacterium]|nr:bifunctional methylenetetrahydrofolate dehydrogenase/methenyltetrahydrofolate cyclohydrolase FolD [Bacteroidales bacterium]RLD38463.1 MAG: bifunctional methylenetetrahydrofolate dehydrogenase/methenyltetrahydrofolate cyclohydrolase FolD [Bacteroidota bacterium]